jgi:hypothetical protein
MLAGPYRVGPWPGLSPSGAIVLIGCALLLAVIDVGGWWYLLLVPLGIATRVVSAPGAASAVCGAYLLPRALLSLVQPAVPLPPLLIIASMAFDLAWWLRAGDIPRRRSKWLKRPKIERTPTALRGAIAGGLFGAVLSAVDGSTIVESIAAVAISAVIGGLSARGTAS